jgi:hypothetical protein
MVNGDKTESRSSIHHLPLTIDQPINRLLLAVARAHSRSAA